MNTLAADWYRDIAQLSFEDGKHGRALYFMANHALDELVERTMRGVEPTEEEISSISYRFEIAAEKNESADEVMRFRSKLIRSFIRPIIWSGVINIDGLTDGQAKNVTKKVGLPDSVDQAAETLAEALSLYDDLMALPKNERIEADVRLGETVGAISEATVISLAGRHATAKLLALPSTAFVDWQGTPKVDGYLFDNRRNRDTAVYPYQVKSTPGDIDPPANGGLPTVGSRILGNMPKHSYWPDDDRRFTTARRLVEERIGDGISSKDSSTLDKISNRVLNFITNKRSSR